jgi:hypothetical protein
MGVDKVGNPWYNIFATTNKTTEGQDFLFPCFRAKRPFHRSPANPGGLLVVATEEMGASSLP